MNKYRYAIIEMEELIDEIVDGVGSVRLKEAAELAIQSIKRQEPMKPDRLDGFRCRNCSGKLARQTDLVGQKHCHHCGQKIDWED